MSDDKTTPETSVSPSNEEPKQTSAKSAGAKPAKRKIAHNAVVSGGDTDPIVYSKARKPSPTGNRKSLTVLHVQRALADLGYADAQSAPGGRWEALTERAVTLWQADRGDTVTGVLTREQFADLFEGDPNVDVTIDTAFDHEV